MTMRWGQAWAWAVVVGLALSGCAHQGKTVPTPKDEPFRIGREDMLEVSVWRDADLSRLVPVRPDGYISMPMIGEVKAEGKTPVQLSEELKEKLKPYVQEPKVTVIVREVNSSRVFVTGEVRTPGSYPLRGRVSALQAIALAGGFTDFADRDGVVIVRRGNEGGSFAVRYSDWIADSENDRKEVVLMPGDTVVVP
jgi:polysaccharide biosynthesis/export protein